MTLSRFLGLLLSLALILPLGGQLGPAAAQETETESVGPLSGRYQLDIPADWAVARQQIRGLTGVFLDEIVAVGDSSEALTSLAAINPTDDKTGNTLIANIFPTALAQASPDAISEDPQDFLRQLLGPPGETATFLTLDGKPAAQTRGYQGPPYTNAVFAGQTLVLDGPLVYFIVYRAESEADLAELEAIAATFHVTDDPALNLDPDLLGFRPAFRTSDGRLQMDIGPDWLVAYSSGTAENFFIVPEPEAMLPFIFGGSFNQPLTGLYIQVTARPYDTLFGTANTAPTAEDRQRLLDQTISNVAGSPAETAESLTIDGAPALRVELESALNGDNRGLALVIDPNQSMYSLVIAGPADRWETDYLPLAEALLDSLRMNNIAPDDVAGDSAPVGTQVGQQAPDFTATLLDGSEVALSDYRGQVVLLNFWATWCAPCRVEMPAFQDAYDQTDGFTVLAVNLMEPIATITPFVDELGLNFPIALDPNGAIHDLYQVSAFPTTYIIGPDGLIQAANAGPVSPQQIERWVDLARAVSE